MKRFKIRLRFSPHVVRVILNSTTILQTLMSITTRKYPETANLL